MRRTISPAGGQQALSSLGADGEGAIILSPERAVTE